MGRILCLNGKSVYTLQFKGSVPYEHLVEAVKNPKYTDYYRIKCMNSIGEVGLVECFDYNITEYLKSLLADSRFNQSAKYALGWIPNTFNTEQPYYD